MAVLRSFAGSSQRYATAEMLSCSGQSKWQTNCDPLLDDNGIGSPLIATLFDGEGVETGRQRTEVQFRDSRYDVILEGCGHMLLKKRAQLAIEQLQGVLTFVCAHGEVEGEPQMFSRKDQWRLWRVRASLLHATIFG